MAKRLLDVGNCDADFSAVCQLVASNFDVTVTRAHRSQDAIEALRSQDYDLVTVNRLMDRDGSEGLKIIQQMKSDPALSATCVMMITNFEDHQAMAVDAGAEPGFGKSQLGTSETIERLRAFLG